MRTLPGFLFLAASTVLLSGCSFFDGQFVTACETALKKYLRSPSGYQRISVERVDIPWSKEEFENFLSDQKTKLQIENYRMQYASAELKPMKFGLLISYDAPNAFGTKVRGKDACEYSDVYGDEKGANEFTVKINGKTYTETLLEQIKR